VTWKENGESVVGILNSGKFTTFNVKDGSERWWITGLPVQTVATPVLGDNMLFINAVGFLGAAENVTQPPSFDKMLTHYDTNHDSLISLAELPGSLLFSDRKNSGGSGSMSVNLFLKYFEGKNKNTKMDRAEWDQTLVNLKQFTTSGKMKTAVCAVRLRGQGDLTAKNILWSESKGVPEVPSSLYYQKRLYLVKSGGVATCREPSTGKLLFEERLGVVGGFFASPVASGGKIYAASDSGQVVVYEANDTLNVLARNDLGEPIFATPAIVEGKLYVRTTGHLYAFGNPSQDRSNLPKQ
jgi:outer membrane protein assembly factor BamB